MQDAILKFDGGQRVIDSDVTAIGRTSDNAVAFTSDTNVSRYHAEIERRGGDHYLIDLQSSNGTTVNGTRVSGEVLLAPGDVIVFGGSSECVFDLADGSANSVASGTDAAGESGSSIADAPGMSAAGSEVSSLGSQASSEAEYAARNALHQGVSNATGADVPTSSSNPTVLIAGIVVGLAVVCAVAAGAFYLTRGTSACNATARIVKPEAGDTISSPVEIEVESENTACVERAVFLLDGQEVATATGPNFSATLDPKEHPELADGVDHSLEIVLIDQDGRQIPQGGGVALAFETRAVAKPPQTPVVAQANTQPGKPAGRGQPSLVQVSDMTQRLVKQFSGSFSYNVSNKQFLQEVQKRSAEYAVEGYSQRAAVYRDTINTAFVREQNIDPPFAYFMAMARSRFAVEKQDSDEGLWRLTAAFVTDNKYNGMCGAETLSDPSQTCAARSAALYAKALIFGVFDGDAIYGAVAFGKSPQDAAAWKATLPQNRSDLWNSVRTPAERDQLVRFFAAGIVAENPQAFGLTKDRPLSDLYRVAM